MQSFLRRAAVIIGLTAGLTACIPEFANPIVGGNKADPALIGSWTGKAKSDDQAMPMTITASGDGLSVVLHDKEASPSSEDMSFIGTTAEIGGKHFINL